MDSEKFSFCLSTEGIVKENDRSNLADMILTMANETEGKILDKLKVIESIKKLQEFEKYGHYVMVIDNMSKLFCAMNMVTYEFNIHDYKSTMWLQSVFVSEYYRMKGLFRKLLLKNENCVKGKENFNQVIKLYMDKNNTKAEQVYFKLGFKTTDEILYELDYDYDDINFLKNDSFDYLDLNNLNKNNLGYSIKIADSNFKEYLAKNLNTSFLNLSNEKKNIKDKFEAIEKVIEDETMGKIVCIYDNKNNRIAGMFFIFYEFSDWRNSIFWWVYDFLIDEEYSEFFNLNKKSVIFSLVKLNHDLNSCGLRFIVPNNKENILVDTVLLKSHYIIFEKKI